MNGVQGWTVPRLTTSRTFTPVTTAGCLKARSRKRLLCPTSDARARVRFNGFTNKGRWPLLQVFCFLNKHITIFKLLPHRENNLNIQYVQLLLIHYELTAAIDTNTVLTIISQQDLLETYWVLAQK